MNETIDVPVEVQPQQTQAMTVREAVGAVEQVKAPVTAAQAKVEAIANLTFKAYERAATLELSEQEVQALQAEFPDEAFKPGAAGKENLIYIEHAFLRDRLNQVFGPGRWAVIPRSRWAEDFRTNSGKPGSRVYVEAMLLVRGAFVAEAIGEMEYFPHNASQNYGDAVEGAKTAALRRCCKELGIGLQAWKKDWCEGWWQRRRAGNKPPPQAPPTRQAPPQSQQAPDGRMEYPTVSVLTVRQVDSKPDAPKKWTAYFIKFSDGFGELEAATFDAKLASLANELANTGENAKLVTEPGKKAGSRAIVSLERAEQPPAQSTTEDDVPMDGNVPADLIP